MKQRRPFRARPLRRPRVGESSIKLAKVGAAIGFKLGRTPYAAIAGGAIGFIAGAVLDESIGEKLSW
ncbi:hypothetical protein [Ferrimonas senticii]|uniref:hypothetical protein n=1 Tax=Ferrimonas senticii TaxID=394566 RepID=UPI0012EC1A58|nr:hypothetical protein [Ferrimonas senticii]